MLKKVINELFEVQTIMNIYCLNWDLNEYCLQIESVG